MSSPSPVRREIATRFGLVPITSHPAVGNSLRAIALTIRGPLAPPDDLVTLHEGLGLYADPWWIDLPGLGGPPLQSHGLEAVAAAVAEVADTAFEGRPVVLLGVSLGATVALAVRATKVRRVVAVEPVLDPTKLWPVAAALRERMAGPAAAKALGADLLGFGGPPIDAFDLIAARTTPVDVILGQAPLFPQRETAQVPSLVDAPERARLAELSGVRLHVAPGAGHHVQREAPRVFIEVVKEACRRASAHTPYDPARVDEPLLEATPLTAVKVLHWGPGGDAFAAAFTARHPQAEVAVGGTAVPTRGAADLDAVVLGAAPPAEALTHLAARLRPGGCLVVRWMSGPDAAGTLSGQLAAARLELLEPVDAAGTGVFRARRAMAGAPPRPALTLAYVAYAPLLMDIRTRLPAQALKTDPELIVHYGAVPFAMEPPPPGTPKVMVLQRPAARGRDEWLNIMKRLLAEGWVAVLEYDDHPRVIAEFRQLPLHSDAMDRFGFVHAVQTSTPTLLEAFRPLNPEIALFPNCVFELLPFPEGPRPRRVVYGGVIRGPYVVEVARSLGPVVERFPDTHFEVLGDMEVFHALPTRNKSFHPYMSFEAYLALISRAAISLSPMDPAPLRDTKSDAKFLDGARAGVLTIASPTIYDRVIRHGENGLLAPEIGDWAPLLSRALAEPEWQAGMARKAWEEVRDRRMFAHDLARRRGWYQDLWTRREALTEALMGRFPELRAAVGG